MIISPRPRFWPFLLAFVVLLILWVLALEMFMKPDVLSIVFATPLRRLLCWSVPPLVVILAVFTFRWGYLEYREQRAEKLVLAEQAAREERERAEAAVARARTDHARYSLEVYGLGLSVCWSMDDWLSQDTVWEALLQGDPHASIPPSDPKAYPWSKNEKGSSGSLPAYETAIKEFPEKWEIPFLLGGPDLHDPEASDRLKEGLCGARSGGGMHFHRFRTVTQVYGANPDHFPADLFSLFDQYQDLPAAAIAVEDSLYLRQMLRPYDAPPLLKNGHEVPTLTGSAAVILLGRRDRVDMLRPTATEIPIREIQVPFEKVLAYEGDSYTADHVASYDDAPPEPQQPDRRNHLRPFWEAQGGAPAAFKPSRFVKRPWCQEQLVQFDRLKVLARLHRPQTAQYAKDGKPLGPRDREKAFLEAWEKALATLPKGQKPARVIYDFGPKGAAHLAPLRLAIDAAGPDLDITGKDGLDVTARLRDTGANAFYVALALGIIATEKEGGVSAVVNLRRDDRATVLMVSPPTPEDKVRRKIHFKSDYMGTVDQE